MCGKKRTGQKTSNYLISMSEDDLRRQSINYLGKLRANFVGTEFRIYDRHATPPPRVRFCSAPLEFDTKNPSLPRLSSGSNPDDLDDMDVGASAAARQELGVIQYESNVMGSRGPRRMQVHTRKQAASFGTS